MPTAQVPSSAPSAHPRTGRNLPVAIATGVTLAAVVVISLAFPLLNWGFVALVAVALSLAVVEVHNALARIGLNSTRWPIIAGAILAGVVPYLVREFRVSGIAVTLHPAGIVFIIIGFTTVVTLGVRMLRGQENFVRDAAASAFTIAYVPLLGSFTTLLLAGSHGAARVTAFILIVVASDTGGYIAGVLFGKHKMTPTISPKKTWEGLAGSFGLAMAVATAFAQWVFHVAWWLGLIWGVVITVAAVIGDLVESMIKRDVGIKDMSNFLPGHGGIMDRLDSLLVAAPWAWLALYLTVPGG